LQQQGRPAFPACFDIQTRSRPITPVKNVESGAHQMLKGAGAVGHSPQVIAFESAGKRAGKNFRSNHLAHLLNQTFGSEVPSIL
jgi:hypothetical protein